MNLIPGLSVITDQSGNYVAQTVGQAPPTVNAAGATTSTYAATLQAGIGPTGLVTAVSLDSTGANVTRNAQYVTATVAPTTTIATGTTSGKSMISFFNASSSNYFKLLTLTATCPPQFQTTGGGLSSTVTTYTQIPFAASFFTTAHTGGTLCTPICHDARDTSSLDSNFSVRLGATISNEAANAVYVWDAAYNARLDVIERVDLGAKILTCGPGIGLNLKCLVAPSSSVNFYMMASFIQTTT